MDKNIIFGILLFIVIILAALVSGLYFKVIDINSLKARFTGKTLSNTLNDTNNSNNNSTISEKDYELITIYLLATDKLLKGYMGCINLCPVDAKGVIEDSCNKGCEKSNKGKDYILRELEGTNYTQDDVNSTEFVKALETDKRVYPLIARLNCITACPKTKSCLNNCIK